MAEVKTHDSLHDVEKETSQSMSRHDRLILATRTFLSLKMYLLVLWSMSLAMSELVGAMEQERKVWLWGT